MTVSDSFTSEPSLFYLLMAAPLSVVFNMAFGLIDVVSNALIGLFYIIIDFLMTQDIEGAICIYKSFVET